MTDTDYNSMSSIERWYWTSIVWMIALVLIHISPYLRCMWTDDNQGITSIYIRVLNFCICLGLAAILWPLNFEMWAFVVPAHLLFCGEEGHSSSSCQSPEDAGIDPFLLVFLPTFLMWGFDTLGCLTIGLIKGRDPTTSDASAYTRCSVFCGQIPRVMFPRFGLTLVYCGLIWFAGSLKTRTELEQLIRSEDMDTDATQVYLERQEIAGIVSFALAAMVWSIPIVIFYREVCAQSRRRVDSSEDQEHEVDIQV
mmetsp:Transcript_7376/g.15951  ORF Transcript_7376/g.15951 Transcript_7376/m.15951 type:complete len:253 (+) Transcript_7376:188-946(+)